MKHLHDSILALTANETTGLGRPDVIENEIPITLRGSDSKLGVIPAALVSDMTEKDDFFDYSFGFAVSDGVKFSQEAITNFVNQLCASYDKLMFEATSLIPFYGKALLTDPQTGLQMEFSYEIEVTHGE